MMEIFTASEVKQSFGKVLMKAQRAPVGINKNGKPVAVVLSAEDFAEYQEVRLKIELAKGLKSADQGELIDGDVAMKGFRNLVDDA